MTEPDPKVKAFNQNVNDGVAVDTDQIPGEAKRMGGVAGHIRTHLHTGPKTVTLDGGHTAKLASAAALKTTVSQWVKWGNERAGDVTATGDATRTNGEAWVDTDKNGRQDFRPDLVVPKPTTLPTS
ncbi:hypothetical protein [Stackebrandtia nassauensis]|uniref:Uncharacterized protein n=1 Tax=Stackebrandtia nassauensis (strain DSM 44728 / CIP 108903 / NRRL B-16338 / NBRC 102104 / LLR-40K-21) TaxID=446470 RepID=D3Q6Z0_STANL|nr:hypothetical protein [Stackebrandtia nassauensis]ADD40389.1 hypothetical protein Snas_0676 [Stackebrandtia nassauensis DSM 44728]